jgi:peptidoglycan hydrolase FlgJ
MDVNLKNLVNAQNKGFELKSQKLRSISPLKKPETEEQKKLFKAAQEFESVMLGMVFKQMRASVGSSDPLDQGQANKIFKDMLDDEYSKTFAAAGGIGLADTLYRQMSDWVGKSSSLPKAPAALPQAQAINSYQQNR